MCGRYTFAQPNQIELRFGIVPSESRLIPRYNIAPTQMVPAVINQAGRRLVMLRWGLIPSWAKDLSIGNKMINARAETLAEKPSFRTLLQRRRCLIIADGFYEWKKEGTGKKPYRITLIDEEPFAFAGLWDSWTSPAGEIIQSCTIITTAANELMQPIHNRMPVILPKDAEQIWADPAVTDKLLLKDLLQPYPAELMTAYEVSPLVNSPKNDLPECLKQV